MTMSVSLAHTVEQFVKTITGNYEERSGCGLTYGTASTFALSNEGKPRKKLNQGSREPDQNKNQTPPAYN
jgi:hypothetical protein